MCVCVYRRGQLIDEHWPVSSIPLVVQTIVLASVPLTLPVIYVTYVLRCCLFTVFLSRLSHRFSRLVSSHAGTFLSFLIFANSLLLIFRASQSWEYTLKTRTVLILRWCIDFCHFLLANIGSATTSKPAGYLNALQHSLVITVNLYIFRIFFVLIDCYRAILCIARTMPSQDVCLSVRMSVCLSVCHTPVFCRNGYTYPHFFKLSGSHIILVYSFSKPNAMAIFRREPH